MIKGFFLKCPLREKENNANIHHRKTQNGEYMPERWETARMYQCLEIQCLKIRKEKKYSFSKGSKQRIAVHLSIFEECVATVSNDIYR